VDESAKSSGSENHTSIRCMELLRENAECVPAACKSDKNRSNHAEYRVTRSVLDSCPISRNNILVYSRCLNMACHRASRVPPCGFENRNRILCGIHKGLTGPRLSCGPKAYLF
jgi:hypothetical protein